MSRRDHEPSVFPVSGRTRDLVHYLEPRSRIVRVVPTLCSPGNVRWAVPIAEVVIIDKRLLLNATHDTMGKELGGE